MQDLAQRLFPTHLYTDPVERRQAIGLYLCASLIVVGSVIVGLAAVFRGGSYGLTVRVVLSLVCSLAAILFTQRGQRSVGAGVFLIAWFGLIYAALLRSLATGSPVWGAATMLAFGLGTSGALIALGLFSSAIRWRLNCWGNRLAAAGVILMGILLLWRGTMPGMLMMGMHAGHACH